MAKSKSVFVCNECGYETTGWLGKCPACGTWNSFFEQKIDTRDIKGERRNGIKPALRSAAFKITESVDRMEKRYGTGLTELDRVLGGGVVKGSLVLVGGDPGIGKSTLLLQLCNKVQNEGNILYVSGEESVSQIGMRAKRLKVDNPNLYLISETGFSEVERYIEEVNPNLLIIDSIQTIYNDRLDSAPGSVSQVRDITATLLRISKTNGITVFIIGHVTKDGAIAGPRVLEHMVDTVLYFEGDEHLNYRILRGVKNRFGSTNEIGIFEMDDSGLTTVENPSEAMLAGRPENAPGSVVTSVLEGSRSMLVEIQALVCSTVYGNARRMAAGIDFNRVTLMMAVLEKRLGLPLGGCDAYVNVIGGLKISEPACDLAIAAAVISSFKNTIYESNMIFIGEIGLTGEIRAVSQISKRLNEAGRIGFNKCVIPRSNYEMLMKSAKQEDKMKLIPVSGVNEILKLFE